MTLFGLVTRHMTAVISRSGMWPRPGTAVKLFPVIRAYRAGVSPFDLEQLLAPYLTIVVVAVNNDKFNQVVDNK